MRKCEDISTLSMQITYGCRNSIPGLLLFLLLLAATMSLRRHFLLGLVLNWKFQKETSRRCGSQVCNFGFGLGPLSYSISSLKPTVELTSSSLVSVEVSLTNFKIGYGKQTDKHTAVFIELILQQRA